MNKKSIYEKIALVFILLGGAVFGLSSISSFGYGLYLSAHVSPLSASAWSAFELWLMFFIVSVFFEFVGLFFIWLHVKFNNNCK